MDPEDTQDTLYETLQVSPRACPQVIRAAYRCLVQLNHPDKNSGSEAAIARLAQINLAYAVLSDPDKHHRYDQVLAKHGHITERRGTGGLAHPPNKTEPSGPPSTRPFAMRPL